MRGFLVVVALLVLGGCSTYSADRYAISADNVVALRAVSGTPGQIGDFTSVAKDKSGADMKEIMCRGVGPITTPDNEPFAQYIKKALVDEMKMAEVYSDSSPVTLSGSLDAIDFSSNSGHWLITLTLKSSNGKSMQLNEKYPYKTSFVGETACNQTAQAFMPAVQNLVGKAVRSPEFVGLVAR